MTYELELIDLDQPRTGYRKFLSAWFYRDDKVAFVVDPGPLSTIDVLIDELLAADVRRLDFILLTHVHIDHAGGTAELLRVFEQSRVFCHENGERHIEEPARLWDGSLKVLGDVARMYGEPSAVPKERIASGKELARAGIKVIPTPGHAPHHSCFWIKDLLFVGEALGTRLPLPSRRPYLRPATPPRFFLEQALASIDALTALEPQPERAAFAHYGLVSRPRQWCEMARQQLLMWVGILSELKNSGVEDIHEAMVERLMEEDPYFGSSVQAELPEDLRRREMDFIGNTIDGMLGYLESSR